MWSVKSEAGTLRAVLVHEVGFSSWETTAPLNNMSKNVLYERSKEQHHKLTEFLQEGGARVFEITKVTENILAKATTADRKKFIEEIWGNERNPEAEEILEYKKREPTPDELKWEHIIYGYPPYPMYDAKSDKVYWPDTPGVVRAGIYARDPSMGTPIGHVINRMRTRKGEPKVVRFIMQHDPELSKNVKIVLDAEKELDAGAIEGGDTQIIDEETIAMGVGQRSDMVGFEGFAEKMFEKDVDKKLKYIVGVEIPGETIRDPFGHLDTTINYPDKGKALVTPYIHTSELVHDLPKRKLLLKTIQARRQWVERNLVGFGRPYGDLFTIRTFLNSGQSHVYVRDAQRGAKKLKTEKSWLDWLITEGKVRKDGIIMVGGLPQNEHDVMHVVHVLQEQFRQAPNIVAIKPGTIVQYERNFRTIEQLESHGVTVKKLPDTYLDMFGGPRCLTCPLDRDAV